MFFPKSAKVKASIWSVLANSPFARAYCRTRWGLTRATGKPLSDSPNTRASSYPPLASTTISWGASRCRYRISRVIPFLVLATWVMVVSPLTSNIQPLSSTSRDSAQNLEAEGFDVWLATEIRIGVMGDEGEGNPHGQAESEANGQVEHGAQAGRRGADVRHIECVHRGIDAAELWERVGVARLQNFDRRLSDGARVVGVPRVDE